METYVKVTEEIWEGTVKDFQVEVDTAEYDSKKWLELVGYITLETQGEEKTITAYQDELVRYLNLFKIGNPLRVEITKYDHVSNGNYLNELNDVSYNTPIREIDWEDIPEPTDEDVEFEAIINEITEGQ